MQRRNILNSPRLDELKRKRQRVFRNKMLLFGFGILIILFGLSFASRISNINISEVNISGTKIVDAESIKSIVKKDLEGHYFWLFPKTNFLIYPKEKIKRDLASNFKRLKSISLELNDIKTLNVKVVEHEGKYLWCGDVLPEVNNNSDQKCYFLDFDGYIFDEAPYFSGEVYFKFYGLTDLNDGNPSGIFFLPELFNKLISLKETLVKIGVKPVALSVLDNGDVEIFLSSVDSSMMGPKIIFKSTADFNKIAENLQAVITSKDFVSDFKNKYASLLYIDLRFGNKVYYKFK